ncbi:hypothetical protein ACI6Q2_13620 [Chitinophagaceae bacterium LWZ2-11]
MKKYILLLVNAFIIQCSFGQSVQLIKGDTTLQKAGSKNLKEHTLNLKFQLIGHTTDNVQCVLTINNISQSIPVKFSGSSVAGTTFTTDSSSITITFQANEFPSATDAMVKTVEKQFKIKLLPENFNNENLVFTIEPSNVQGQSKVNVCPRCNYVIGLTKRGVTNQKTPQTDIYYLNAYNFDFTSSLKSNYLGQFNVFYHGNKKLGISTGFTFINYNVGNSDSAQNFFIQKMLINPLADSIGQGQKYLKQLNKYVTQAQNSSKSIYCQLLFPVVQSKILELYTHLHCELLINKNVLTTTITTIKQDTITALSTIPVDSSFFRYEGSSYISSTTLVNGYFGVGLTAYLTLLDSVHLFLQPTVGYTTNYPQYGSINEDIKNTPIAPIPRPITPYGTLSSTSNNLPIKANPAGGWFYYIRGYLDYDVSTSTKLLIGAEIRGLFPKFSPYYAVYAGVNLSIPSILNLLK